jgi:PKD repeat protein
MNTSTAVTPTNLTYLLPGTYTIDLTAFNGSGAFASASSAVIVSNSVAPNILIQQDATQCVAVNKNFNAQTVDPISTYSWNFGDGLTATQSNPVHSYASAGSYQATLLVSAPNGCTNQDMTTVIIYNRPVSDFSLPGNNPLCTGQALDFQNTSTSDPGSAPTWQWFVNGTPAGNALNLQYTFASTSLQTIDLIATIPGCSGSSSKQINSLLLGPNTDFTFLGICNGTQTNFTNGTSGSITGFAWDFGDGGTSTSVSPSHLFATPAAYQVKLTASNAAGCQNFKTKTVTI